MAYEATSIVGSGINPLKKQLPVNATTNRRNLRGTSVVLINPEDASAGGSGVTTVGKESNAALVAAVVEALNLPADVTAKFTAAPEKTAKK